MMISDDDGPSIEERALRHVLGNQALIMQALARLLTTNPAITTFSDERDANILARRADQTEAWKNTYLPEVREL